MSKATEALATELLDLRRRLRVLEMQEPSGGTDPNAIHVNVAAEISAIAAKAVPIGADYLVIEDSAAGDAKKSVTLADLPVLATVPDHAHDGIAGDGAQISHDSALTDISADDHHAEDHKDRHDPEDGADPLDTEAPVDTGTANAIGISHNLNRGDHVHKLHDHAHAGVAGDGAQIAHNTALSGIQGGAAADYYHLTLVRRAHLITMINANLMLLTSSEVSQLRNIGVVTISAAQWAYLGALDQALAQADSPTFDDLNLTGSILASTALGCRVYSNVANVIGDSAATLLDFTTEISDTDTCWAAGANADKLYAKTAGYYITGCGVVWDANATGRRTIAIVDEDGDVLAQQINFGGATALQMSVVSGMQYMAVNDYVTFSVWQNSGGNLNVRAATVAAQHFCVGWLMRIA